MRVLIQRVISASVSVGGSPVSSVNAGLLVFLGVMAGDTETDADYLAKKTAHLRIFEDERGRMNRSLKEAGGEALVVSQFTLCADCSRGLRPSFDSAESPERARGLYEYFMLSLAGDGIPVHSGSFGDFMQVSLVNDGPVTILLESKPKRAMEKP